MKTRTIFLITLLLVGCISISSAVKIQWFGQSAFCITAQDGTKIITDPYEPGSFNGKLNYGPITTKADIVTVSHNDADHNYVKGVPGNPQVIQSLGITSVKNIAFRGIQSYHDKEQGQNRGQNTIYTMVVDDVRICHLGDLGHLLNPTQVKQIGTVDVLLIPVGGVFTIDGNDAMKVIDQLNPKVIIPMHYKTDKITLPLKPVDLFTKDKKNVIGRQSSSIEVSSKTLPPAGSKQIDVLQPAL